MPDALQEFEALQNIATDFLSSVDNLEAKILRRVNELLDSYDSKGGKFETSAANKQKLLQIEKEITDILTKSGYFKAANIYIADLAKITENTQALHADVNKLEIQKSSLTGIEKVYAQNAVNHLKASGLSTNFILPVTQIVNEATTFGYSIANTRKTLAEFVSGDPEGKVYGKLKSYLTTTARDTVSQLQGAQHQAIANEFDMSLIRYVGGLLKDSRGQCVKWHNMTYLPVKDLQKLIDEAFANQAAKLEQPKGHKWSGMLKDTTPENFLIRRGGWGCLHGAIPVRRKA